MMLECRGLSTGGFYIHFPANPETTVVHRPAFSVELNGVQQSIHPARYFSAP